MLYCVDIFLYISNAPASFGASLLEPIQAAANTLGRVDRLGHELIRFAAGAGVAEGPPSQSLGPLAQLNIMC